MSELFKQVQSVCKVGNFTLTSGRQATFYIDIKELLLKGKFLEELAYTLLYIIDETMGKDIDFVGGMELGSVPITSAICSLTELDKQFIIRKKPREHGTKSQVEGWEDIKGKNVVLIDDVLTTGKSLRKMYEVLKGHANVVGCVVVVDRQDVDKETLTDLPPIYSLFTKEELTSEEIRLDN